jgi:hypothetical protein
LKLAENGNATMLIWPRKNYLGQKDKIDDIDDEDSQPLKHIFKVNLTQIFERSLKELS